MKLPDFLPFQHPRLVNSAPRGSGWITEIKFDGYRFQLRVERSRATWRTRRGFDWSDRLPDLSAAAAALPDGIYDGEICAVDASGNPDFSALSAALARRRAGAIQGTLVLFAFDLLWDRSGDLRPLPLRHRKARLLEALEPSGEPRTPLLRYVGELPGTPADLHSAACAMQLEGIVCKRPDAPYVGGEDRPESWVKLKCRPTDELVIGGWHSRGPSFHSLLMGRPEPQGLRYVGSVKVRDRDLPPVLPELGARETGVSPFAGAQPKKKYEMHWVRPELVAEVEVTDWTASGSVRHGFLKALRPDREPADLEEPPQAKPPPKAAARPQKRPAAPDPAGVPIEHPDKALWPATPAEPAITKADLSAYYVAVAPWLVPYFEGRPCIPVIAPDGVGGPQTWVRHEGYWQGLIRTSPLITHLLVPEKEKTYPAFDSAAALAVAADIACVELHPWNSLPWDPLLPERLVFDVDPQPGQGWDQVISAAEEFRDRLAEAGLVAFLKTTGGKGVHVVTRFLQDDKHRVTWAQSTSFAKTLCQSMAADSPERYTVEMRKDRRGDRIFLDYLRNGSGQHAVGLLSPRLWPGAPVSMPVSWKGAGKLVPKAFTIRTAPGLLRKQYAWAGYHEAARPLPL